MPLTHADTKRLMAKSRADLVKMIVDYEARALEAEVREQGHLKRAAEADAKWDTLDLEAAAYHNCVRALRVLEDADRRGTSPTSYTTLAVGSRTPFASPIGRVLDAVAARFGLVVELKAVVEALGRAELVQQEKEELERLRLAVRQINDSAYPPFRL